jgi:hypothetical protein
MRVADTGASRRAVLRLAAAAALGASGLALGGCRLPGGQTEWRSGADPLTPFYLATLALAAGYDGVIAALPELGDRLTPLRDDHRAHAAALAKELAIASPDPSPPAASIAATPGDPDAALAELASAEKAALKEASAACLAAPGWRATLLGSIAACRAAHLEALR